MRKRVNGRHLAMLGLLISGLILAGSVAAANAKLQRNVVFGMYAGLALNMDVYHPNEAKGIGMLLIPGSGWHNPRDLKQGYPYINAVRQALVQDGYTVFVPNHRSSPTFRFPSALIDVRRAVQYIRSNASRFNIDPARIGGVGHSSGAHLISLLAVQRRTREVTSDDPIAEASSRIQAAVTIAAPFDMTAYDPGFGQATVTAFMGERPATDAERRPLRTGIYREASPVSFVSADDGPFLIIHGENDPVVPYRNLELMRQALQDVGATVATITVAGAGHAPELDLERMVTWLNENLDGGLSQ